MCLDFYGILPVGEVVVAEVVAIEEFVIIGVVGVIDVVVLRVALCVGIVDHFRFRSRALLRMKECRRTYCTVFISVSHGDIYIMNKGSERQNASIFD